MEQMRQVELERDVEIEVVLPSGASAYLTLEDAIGHPGGLLTVRDGEGRHVVNIDAALFGRR